MVKTDKFYPDLYLKNVPNCPELDVNLIPYVDPDVDRDKLLDPHGHSDFRLYKITLEDGSSAVIFFARDYMDEARWEKYINHNTKYKFSPVSLYSIIDENSCKMRLLEGTTNSPAVIGDLTSIYKSKNINYIFEYNLNAENSEEYFTIDKIQKSHVAPASSTPICAYIKSNKVQ